MHMLCLLFFYPQPFTRAQNKKKEMDVYYGPIVVSDEWLTKIITVKEAETYFVEPLVQQGERVTPKKNSICPHAEALTVNMLWGLSPSEIDFSFVFAQHADCCEQCRLDTASFCK